MKKILLMTMTCIVACIANAQFTANDIRFWTGEGESEVVLVIDFLEEDITSFAWGYRFDGEADIEQALMAVAAADPTLSVVLDGTFLSDVYYRTYEGVGGEPNYFGIYSIKPGEEEWASNAGLSETIADGEWIGFSYTDFDPEVTPREPVAAAFYGSGDTTGQDAVAMDSTAIVAWASGYSDIQRGYINISDPEEEYEGSNRATSGTPEDALGEAEGTSVDAVSLGDAGFITLTFNDPIYNGEGADFVVFDNSFSHDFIELAFVEVSSDGENFYRFPAVSLTPADEQLGLGNIDPSGLHNLAGKYIQGYGTPFDLEDLEGTSGLNLEAVTHVRIVDVVGSIDPEYATYDHRGEIINDPFTTPYNTGGFDLDAVGVIHENITTSMNIAKADDQVKFYPNPVKSDLTIEAKGSISEVLIYTAEGMLEAQVQGNGTQTLQLDGLAKKLSSGYYITRVVTSQGTISGKIVVQ